MHWQSLAVGFRRIVHAGRWIIRNVLLNFRYYNINQIDPTCSATSGGSAIKTYGGAMLPSPYGSHHSQGLPDPVTYRQPLSFYCLHRVLCTRVLHGFHGSYLSYTFPHTWFPSPLYLHKCHAVKKFKNFDLYTTIQYYTTENIVLISLQSTFTVKSQ